MSRTVRRTALRTVWRTALRPALVLATALAWVGWAPSAGGTAAAASWSWPVTGVVTRPFAPPPHRYGAGHRGVDLLTAPGAPVRAAGAGRVSYAGLLAGRGVMVVVHGALRTTYEPVTAAVGLGACLSPRCCSPPSSYLPRPPTRAGRGRSTGLPP